MQVKNIQQVEENFRAIAAKLGANDYQVEKFLSDDPEDQEYAVCAISGIVGGRTQDFDKARKAGELLQGLRDELTGLRANVKDAQQVAVEVLDYI